MTRRLLVAAVVCAVAGVTLAQATHQTGHDRPQGSAASSFARDFPELLDAEWSFPIGGFGGIGRGAARTHVPVIFVHGNNVDAADWYPVQDAFKAAGWTDQELWALSYNGLGGNNGSALATPNPRRDAEHGEMGWDGQSRVTANDVNVPDLASFIRAVRVYTGAARFSIVAHSLGVTLARRTLHAHPELRPDLVAFVGIAGANHGTSFCPPGSESRVHSCDEIAAGTPWLEQLNGPDGVDETYGPARWLTIYDGSGAGDPAYAGPMYAQSPTLLGAENREYPGTYHNDLRMDPSIVDGYRAFLEDAEVAVAPVPRPRVEAGRQQRPLPATGVGASAWGGLRLLLALLVLALLVGRLTTRAGRASDDVERVLLSDRSTHRGSRGGSI